MKSNLLNNLNRQNITFLEKVILFSFFLVLPIDNINGVLLKSFSSTLSISLLFKFVLILLLVVWFLFYQINHIAVWLIVLTMFSVGAFHNYFLDHDLKAFIDTISFNLKFLVSLLVFWFLRYLYVKKNLSISWVDRFFVYSLAIVSINLFLGAIGFGYAQYTTKDAGGDIGYIGYFYSGNELSALMIILILYLTYRLWMQAKYRAFFFFFLFCLFISFLKSTKTTILGVVIIFFFVPFLNKKYIPSRVLVNLLFSYQIFIPILIVIISIGLIFTNLYERFYQNWQKLDILTFIFSTRNVYAFENYKVFSQGSYTDQLFGVGFSKFIMMTGKTTEIDFCDILFFNGYFGLGVLISVLMYYWSVARKRQKRNKSNYSQLVLFSLFVLVLISNLAGHVFTAGLVVVYLGVLFALVYVASDLKNSG